MSTQSGVLTLSEVCDEYLINRMIDKKKNFVSYMVIAKRAWQKVFWNTIYSTQSSWATLQNGLPYDYVPLPSGISRFFTASVQDKHGRIQPLFYNSQLNIIPQPVAPSCGCTDPNCNGIDTSTTTVTTKLLFTINGINYYEKDYIKTCSNGDVILWKEIPTKKYNDFIGQSGDYNTDFNDDFSNGNPGLSNFSIVTQTFQEKICKLDVRPCGCPVPSTQNIQTINDCCSAFFPFGINFRHGRHHSSNSPLNDINSNEYGEVKMSECGTRLYFKPTLKWWEVCPNDPLIPTYLLLNYQTNGLSCTEETLVPEYALDYMFASMDWRSKRFNSKYSLGEKQQAKYEMNDEENKIISFLNPLNLQEIANTQDANIRW